jgi:hypothetical protein
MSQNHWTHGFGLDPERVVVAAREQLGRE